MENNFRWVSVLLPANIHKELTIMALDKGVNLGHLGKVIMEEFIKDKKWQSQVISKVSK